MKLFARYNRINYAVTIGIFLLGTLAFWMVLYYLLQRELDRTLISEKQEIEKFVSDYHHLPPIENTRLQQVHIRISDSLFRPEFETKYRFNSRAHEKERLRVFEFPLQLGDSTYVVTVIKSAVETEDLIRLLVPVVIFIVGLILLAGLLINRRMLARLWKPFYDSLQKVQEYRVTGQEPLHLPPVDIDELDQLNRTLNEMIERIHRDYRVLKEYTQNAAHEMQTPLAIIRSKVDLLLQYPGWDEKMLLQWQGIEEATERLARLHESLLLLTKLENRQFVASEEIRLDTIVNEKLQERSEWLPEKKLTLEVASEPVKLAFHRQLAEILVSNLINNALRYTPPGGRIRIDLNSERMLIANTAVAGPLDYNKVFQRFYKADPAREGNGLGLAIVQQIASLGGFEAQYRFEEGEHQFIILFHSSNRS